MRFLTCSELEATVETDPEYQTSSCRPRSSTTSAKRDYERDPGSNKRKFGSIPIKKNNAYWRAKWIF